MARPRQFDPDKAVAAAMELFWREGYDGVSFDDLVQATGASRRGLYSLWNGKEALFAAAIQRYRQEIGDHFFAELEQPGAGRVALEAFWERFEQAARHLGARSCLVMKTAQHPMARVPAVAAEIDAYNERLRLAFEGALARAVTAGEVDLTFDPATVSRILLGLATATASETARHGFSDEAARLIAAGREVSGLTPSPSPTSGR